MMSSLNPEEYGTAPAARGGTDAYRMAPAGSSRAPSATPASLRETRVLMDESFRLPWRRAFVRWKVPAALQPPARGKWRSAAL